MIRFRAILGENSNSEISAILPYDFCCFSQFCKKIIYCFPKQIQFSNVKLLSDIPKLRLVLQHYPQWHCRLFSWLCNGSNWKILGWRNLRPCLYCYFTFSPNIEHSESFIFGGRVTLKSGQRKNWFLRGIYQALVSKTYVLQGFIAIKYWDEKVKGQL